MDRRFEIELADGKNIITEEVARGCKLTLCDHDFEIDLLPVGLGSFDVVVGMDWLAAMRVVIVCGEKIVQIPLGNRETLSVQGERHGAPLRIITCMKAQKCLRKGDRAFLAHVVDKDSAEPKLEEIPVVRDFPEDLSGLPPP